MIQQVRDIRAVPRITRGPQADALASAAYDQVLADLATLEPADWARPTECTGWTVRDMVAHLVGAAEGHASMAVFLRQSWYGLRHKRDFDGNEMDAMNDKQIRDQDGLADAELVDRLRELAGPAVAGRRSRARWLGFVPLPLSDSGSSPAGLPRTVSLGQLCAVTLTRDVWMHRLDLARALDREPVVDPAVDAVIVADVAAEWCDRHGQPVELELTGPAGGTFIAGTGGARLTMDALDLCRVLAGRRPASPLPPSPLLRTPVLF